MNFNNLCKSSGRNDYEGGNKIVWNNKRWQRDNTLFYPIADPNGDFEVQGKKYLMREYTFGGDEDEV